MATNRQKVMAILDSIAELETVRISDVITGGHPDPENYADLGFTVWIRGTRRFAAEQIAEVADED